MLTAVGFLGERWRLTCSTAASCSSPTASTADLYFIAARTEAQAKGSRGLSLFLVEKGTPGFRIGRARPKTGWLYIIINTTPLLINNAVSVTRSDPLTKGQKLPLTSGILPGALLTPH